AGRWWTVLTAGWLHAGLLHIFFNMMWIRQLAPPTSEMYGPSRMIIIYTIAGIIGFTASTLAGAFIRLPILGGAGFTVGASAPIFGLLGALVYYGRRSGSSVVGGPAKSWAVTLFLFRFFFSRRGQLGTPWPFCWRVRGGEIPGSFTSGTSGSPDRGSNMSGHDSDRYRVLDCVRPQLSQRLTCC